MPSRRHVLVLCAAFAAAPPTPAAAQTPGTGGAEAAPEPEVSAASVGPVSVATRAGALLGRTTRFRGAIPAADAGRTVVIERLDPLTGQWAPISRAVAGRDGAYLARWRTDRTGRQDVRVRVESPGATAASAAPQVGVTVFEGAQATWYGPGFYGRTTACGLRFTRTTPGVAHKTLPCGTRVTVFHAGRSTTVPVIDRGPHMRGVTWDLSVATARALGFTGKGTIGALPQPPQTPSR